MLPEIVGVEEIIERNAQTITQQLNGDNAGIMPLHYLRAQYAQDLYRYFAERGTATGNMYYCRAERKGQAYDKGILLAVSQQMGHSRCDVVVSHYLY